MNGPALAGHGSQFAIAWYTEGSDGHGKVKLAWAEQVGDPITVQVVDAAEPVGRPDIGFLVDGSIVVSWIGRDSAGGASVRVQRFWRERGSSAGGTSVTLRATGPATDVATVTGTRRDGFPRLACFDSRALLVWTAAGERASVRAAVLQYPPRSAGH